MEFICPLGHMKCTIFLDSFESNPQVKPVLEVAIFSEYSSISKYYSPFGVNFNGPSRVAKDFSKLPRWILFCISLAKSSKFSKSP